MRKLFSADTRRLLRNRWFWLCLGGMLAMSVAFIIMQKTAMDYTVPLSRVIFLPMSFFGMAVAALVSLFVGEDFSDGFIRNKLIAGRLRPSVFASHLIVSGVACIIIYLMVVFFTSAVGCFFFEINLTAEVFFEYLLLGLGMCIAYGSIYCTITQLCGNKTTATVVCMGLAFFFLCLSLHTNQVMVQPEYKDGVLNPSYVDGTAKVIYGVIHDLNPTGQAAQLSTMNAYNPFRMLACDVVWVAFAAFGAAIFQRKDIK